MANGHEVKLFDMQSQTIRPLGTITNGFTYSFDSIIVEENEVYVPSGGGVWRLPRDRPARRRDRRSKRGRAGYVRDVLAELPHRHRGLLVPHDDEIRVKGSSTFQVYARRSDKVHLINDGELLAPGDAIRFVAGASGKKYVLVVSIDSRSTASVYFPFSGITSALVGDGTHELPGSIVLDATPGPERLFVIFSVEPLASGPLLEQLRSIATRDAIRSTTTLDLDGATQRTLLFEKAAP